VRLAILGEPGNIARWMIFIYFEQSEAFRKLKPVNIILLFFAQFRRRPVSSLILGFGYIIVFTLFSSAADDC
jgi:hypothetical protein